MPCQREAATVGDAQVTYFANHSLRIADDHYRAAGGDIGSGLIESGCETVIGHGRRGQ